MFRRYHTRSDQGVVRLALKYCAQAGQLDNHLEWVKKSLEMHQIDFPPFWDNGRQTDAVELKADIELCYGELPI